MTGELRLFYDAVKQQVPADILVKNYGKSKKDKAQAAHLLTNLRDTISLFREGEKACASFIVGKYVINLFQKEDGTLDMGYSFFDERENRLVTRQLNLNITAKALSGNIGINMVENETVFGKANTGNIIRQIRDIDGNMSEFDRSSACDTASAYLRTRLGVSNTQLTNYPADQLVQMAKSLENNTMTNEAALLRIK